MSSYPDWCYGPTLCRYEGHEYHGGSACVRCGDRLRCWCGRFIRADDEAHYQRCPAVAAMMDPMAEQEHMPDPKPLPPPDPPDLEGEGEQLHKPDPKPAA